MRTSIVIPIFNGEAFLRECIASLAASGWDERDELILVDNASTDGVPAYLDTVNRGECPHAAQIGSVTVIRNTTNRNFAGACNQGMATAQGKWICFLNSDITAHEGWLDALLADAHAHDAQVVGARLLYPNGTIQHAGVSVEPSVFPRHLFRFKSGDHPDAVKSFECQIVTGACMLVEAGLARALGGFDELYRNGCEDVDICWRAREHGARVWYCGSSVLTHHESMSPGRHDFDDANVQLLSERWRPKIHADRVFDDEILQVADPSLFWRQPVAQTSIIIPLFNNVDLTRACVESILAVGLPLDTELILVDNASTDKTAWQCRQWASDRRFGGRLRTVRLEQNHNFAGACNAGAAHSLGQRIIFLNNDTRVTEGWIEALITPLADTRVGVVGARLVYPDGTVQHAGVAFGEDRVGFHINAGVSADDPRVVVGRELQAVTGACMALRQADFLSINGFDERYLNGAEDLDLCVRIRKRKLCVWYEPSCVVIHEESQSEGRFKFANQNLSRFLQSHATSIVADAAMWEQVPPVGYSEPAVLDVTSQTGQPHWNLVLPLLQKDPKVGDVVSWADDRALTIVDGGCDLDVMQRFNGALAASSASRIVVSFATSYSELRAELDALNEELIGASGFDDGRPIVTLSRPGSEYPVLILHRRVIDRVGGLDLRYESIKVALLDLVYRARNAGFLWSDLRYGRLDGDTAGRMILDRSGSIADERRFAERWISGGPHSVSRNLSPLGTLAPDPNLYMPLVTEPLDPGAQLDVELRDVSVLLRLKPGHEDAFVTAAQDLVNRAAGKDVSVVVDLGNEMDRGLGLLERALDEFADDQLPDITVLHGPDSRLAGVVRSVSAVIIAGPPWHADQGLALMLGRPVSSSKAAFDSLNTSARRAA